MYYVYILLSKMDGKFYTGCANDLKKRIEKHNSGQVDSTKNRRPLKLIYYEASLNRDDAYKREKYLKTAWGKRYVRSRLNNFLINQNVARPKNLSKNL